jgi:hypothetical protein
MLKRGFTSLLLIVVLGAVRPSGKREQQREQAPPAEQTPPPADECARVQRVYGDGLCKPEENQQEQETEGLACLA